MINSNFLKFKKHVSIFFFLISYQTIYADEVGVITKVIDGDTVYLLNDKNHKLKIRLEHIDAPEIDQSFGIESKLILQNFVLNKNVLIIGDKVDKYKRFLGVIIYDGIDINLEMIKEGAAWHYRKFAKLDQTKEQFDLYNQNEHQAKLKKIGLWKEDAVSPWLWRKNKK